MSESGEEIAHSRIEEEEQDYLLSEQTYEHLIESGYNLLTELFSDYPNELPDMLFPQTSAQVLPYFLGPSIHKVTEQRHSKIPKNFYFQPPLRQEADLSNHGVERIRSAEISIRKNFPESIIPVRSPYQIREDAYRHRALAGKRAEEVRQYQTTPHTPLIIVDDFASHEGTTISAIRRAFEDVLPAYIFAATPSPLTIDEYNLHFAPIKVGHYVMEKDYSDHIAYLRASNAYFSYREFPLAVGYVRNPDSIYAKRLKQTDQKGSDLLRKELREIGKALAEEF